MNDVHLLFELRARLSQSYLLPVRTAADQSLRQESVDAELLDILTLCKRRQPGRLRLEKPGNQVAVQLAVVQDAEGERDEEDQDALYASNIRQEFKKIVAISYNQVLVRAHLDGDPLH